MSPDLLHALRGIAYLLGAVCTVFTIYFAPSIVGFARHRPNRGAILVLNIFLGWTFVGWVIALVWAVANKRE